MIREREAGPEDERTSEYERRKIRPQQCSNECNSRDNSIISGCCISTGSSSRAGAVVLAAAIVQVLLFRQCDDCRLMLTADMDLMHQCLLTAAILDDSAPAVSVNKRSSVSSMSQSGGCVEVWEADGPVVRPNEGSMQS